jgi:hypothetical protein
MASLLIHLLALLPVSATCLTNYDKTACGYSCLAAHGEVACARTPAGICSAVDNRVVCWDPPEWVRLHYGDKLPPPQCLTRDGKIACGYRCEAHDEDVACATTPDGICQYTYQNGIACWDPQPSTYCADRRALPRPECVVLDGRVACGYHCEARNGKIGCAATPGGRCTVQPDQILCWDPEPPPMCGAQACEGASERSWCAPVAPSPSPTSSLRK